jgi:hypothetical protein
MDFGGTAVFFTNPQPTVATFTKGNPDQRADIGLSKSHAQKKGAHPCWRD